MHAFIITGANPDKRQKYLEKRIDELKISPFNCIAIRSDTVNIGIADIRDLQHQLVLKPTGSQYSLGVIYDAEKLTTEAQNALLKTLEEPPAHALIYLLMQNAQSLLPTIFSRCQIIDLGKSTRYSKEELTQTLELVMKLRNYSIGKRLGLIDGTFTNRDDAEVFLERALYALEEQLNTGVLSQRDLSKLLRKILTARQQLSANVNPKLILDNIFS